MAHLGRAAHPVVEEPLGDRCRATRQVVEGERLDRLQPQLLGGAAVGHRDEADPRRGHRPDQALDLGPVGVVAGRRVAAGQATFEVHLALLGQQVPVGLGREPDHGGETALGRLGQQLVHGLERDQRDAVREVLDHRDRERAHRGEVIGDRGRGHVHRRGDLAQGHPAEDDLGAARVAQVPRRVEDPGAGRAPLGCVSHASLSLRSVRASGDVHRRTARRWRHAT